MNSNYRLIVAILVIGALAVGFWMLLLGPKREKVDELSQQVDSLNAGLVQAQSEVTVAEDAKRAFPADYRQLVSLGEAVPEGDETSSLLVELSTIARDSKVSFEGLQLSTEGGGAPVEGAVTEVPVEPAAEEASGAVPAAAAVPPTEAAASLMPLGATIGPAGLGIMPYTLTFGGNFFQVADFIAGVDSLVGTKATSVGADGRLITIDGFSLTPRSPTDPKLDASFVVTTYVIPPEQGLTAGASPTEPAPSTPAPANTEAESEAAPAAETVAAQ